MCNPGSEPKRNVVLIGFMGSGKSSVGAAIARRLGCELVDTDELIEAKDGRRIPDIFAQEGEEAFRDLESEAVREAAARTGVVISTGGGAVLRPENIASLRKTGVLFLLDATPEAIYERVADETHRPLLRCSDPLKRIEAMLETRRPHYAQADIIVETTGRTIDEIVDEVLDRCRCL